MIGKLFTKIVGSRNDRILRRMSKAVDKINDLEPEMQRLSDTQLRAKTDHFKTRLADGDTLAAVMSLSTLRGPVDRFFEQVTVNTDDSAVRENRLRLLARVRETMSAVADFSRIEG